uniref:Growth arrest-specific protein 8 n=1 Tax=Gongylonema pulchrum TaxID=637853 RepID=A0A183D7Y1_9BILA
LKKELAGLQKKNAQLVEEVAKLTATNDDLRSELTATQQKWSKDKDNLLHKARQEEKIRNVELDALQQKFASRMRIMEDTNKSLHSQLVQARRERDYHREALYTFERKMSEEQQNDENDVKRQKELKQKCADMVFVFNKDTKQIQNLTEEVAKLNTDLKLSKEAHEADRALWAVEKSHIKPNKSATLGNSTVANAQNIKAKNQAKRLKNVKIQNTIALNEPLY